MSVAESLPYMGKVDIDLTDPSAETYIESVREKIGEVGLKATELFYPGRLMIFYGLEHTTEYQQGEEPPVRRLSFEPTSV